jgi:hypothetical protein
MLTNRKITPVGLSELLSAILILVYVYAAASKVMELRLFHAQLDYYPYLKPFSGLLFWFVPSVEISIALLLIVPEFRFFGFFLSSILISVFTGYFAAMIFVFNRNLPCPCGGLLRFLDWKQHIILNLTLIAISILGIRMARSIHPRLRQIKT